MTKVPDNTISTWALVPCSDCAYFQTGDWCHLKYGECVCITSDHFGHVLSGKHIACGQWTVADWRESET